MSRHINIQGLSVGYSATKAVCTNINAEVQQGQLVALLGPNGAGKSTLLRTVAGLLKPLKGTVQLNDTPIEQLRPSERAATLALVLTERQVFGDFSVADFVALGRYPYTNWLGQMSDADISKVEEALAFTGLQQFAQRSILNLSDGERQRVQIARAIAQDTPILILDEPTAFLDLVNRRKVLELLHKLSKEKGKTVLFSTHELDLARKYADTLWLIDYQQQFHQSNTADSGVEALLKQVFEIA